MTQSVYHDQVELARELGGDDVLRLPFDMYQRYWVAAQLLERLLPDGARVLEVGAAPGPSSSFFTRYDLFLTDRYGAKVGRYVTADGASLPFAAGAFDAVVTLDTLEHIPRAQRAAFLSECARVSSDAVLLCAPFSAPEVELAEEALHVFVQQRLHQDFPTLREHRDHGLPDLATTERALAGSGRTVACLPSGFLPRWLAGMLVHHELLALGSPALNEMHAYYNATVAASDQREPAYRHFVIATRSKSTDELARVVDELRSQSDTATAHATLAAMAGFLIQNRVAGVASARAALEQEKASLERVVADRDAHLVELRQRIEQLTAELDAMRATLHGALRREAVLQAHSPRRLVRWFRAHLRAER